MAISQMSLFAFRWNRNGAANNWLLDKDPDGCDQNLKLLTRTATNTYFPQVLTIISLPSEEDELTKMVAELSGELTSVQSIEHVAMAKQFNARIAASLGPFSDQDIFERHRKPRFANSG